VETFVPHVTRYCYLDSLSESVEWSEDCGRMRVQSCHKYRDTELTQNYYITRSYSFSFVLPIVELTLLYPAGCETLQLPITASR
jgi:hypothetical protein